MSMHAYRLESCGYGSVVPVDHPVELFPAAIEDVFNRLEALTANNDLYESEEVRPSAENVEWAKRVLLRVMPRQYLIGAEIDTFHGEIHVTWEHGNKRVVAFLPVPNELKLYCEQIGDQGVVDHHLRSGNDPWVISGVLRWLYQ